MLMGPRIPERQLFKKFTLKIQGQGHGWGQSSKSQCESNILATHIPFIPCQSGFPLLSQGQGWGHSSKSQCESSILATHIPFIPCQSGFPLLSQGQGWGHSSKSQCGSSILSTHISFVPCQSALPFLRYGIFKIWPWKSRVKVTGEVTFQSHNLGLASYRLTSLLFHVNRPSHSWDTAFSKFDLENQGSRSNDPDVAQLQV